MIRRPGEIEQIIEKTAKLTAEKIYEKLIEKSKNSRNMQIYNTRLLLENYKIFKVASDNAIFDLSKLDEENESAFEILDSMWQRFGTGKEELKVQSIVKSSTRTRIIYEHISNILCLYKSFCYNSGKDENIFKWEIIQALYIDDLKMNSKSEIRMHLAERFFTNTRTIYRWQLDAIEKLSVLLFGIDALANKVK